MKRVIAIGAVLVAAIALVVFATGSGDGGGGYRVRAIFDNASFVITGEDVKIAGVKVGKIESLDVTPDKKAAVVLDITNSDYHDFRQDAFCTIRPQGLIGEKFIECEPTQPRPAGTTAPPELRQIQSGPGKGQYLLPATHTAKAVDLDLINNIMRLPVRQRFTILINEFGTGLAGNGANLNAALKKSSPALREFDEVLGILARQNRQLASLAENGDAVLAPLAARKEQVAGFIRSSGATAEATAERSADLELDIKKFPAFLRELNPTLDSLSALSTSLTPVIQDLGDAAPSINAFVTGTPEFSKNATTALTSLGDTTQVAGPALTASLPLVQDLGTLGKAAKPLSSNLASLLTSLQAQGGIERLMDFVFYGAGATNGYDQYGHYLRARLVLTTCQTYVQKNSVSCTANFNKDLGATTAQPKGTGRSSGSSSSSSSAASTTAGASDAIRPPKALLPGDDSTPAAKAAAPKASPAKTVDPTTTQSLLDYLLGQ